MDWGDPEFVLSLVSLALFASVLKAVIHAKYGRSKHERLHGQVGKDARGEIEGVRGENARLTERVEAYEERIAVLERIVTDSSYRLGHEIERLRDAPAPLESKGKVQ